MSSSRNRLIRYTGGTASTDVMVGGRDVGGEGLPEAPTFVVGGVEGASAPFGGTAAKLLALEALHLIRNDAIYPSSIVKPAGAPRRRVDARAAGRRSKNIDSP